MEIKLAKSYGFCFGVKRAIKIAETTKNSNTLGPLIHNKKEIDRLKNDFNVGLYNNLDDAKQYDTVIIRTHGIPKDDLKKLKQKDINVINATCPFVTTPQQIVKKMTNEEYSIILFGDEDQEETQIDLETYTLYTPKEIDNRLSRKAIPAGLKKAVSALLKTDKPACAIPNIRCPCKATR